MPSAVVQFFRLAGHFNQADMAPNIVPVCWDQKYWPSGMERSWWNSTGLIQPWTSNATQCIVLALHLVEFIIATKQWRDRYPNQAPPTCVNILIGKNIDQHAAQPNKIWEPWREATCWIWDECTVIWGGCFIFWQTLHCSVELSQEFCWAITTIGHKSSVIVEVISHPPLPCYSWGCTAVNAMPEE